MTDTEKLLQLKELLLTEDRDFANDILRKLDLLEETVYVNENLSEKVNPIIDRKIETLIDEMPDKLGPTITATLKSEIKNSQDSIVDALFPIIGKMIKKYIQQEMKTLSDNINAQVQSTFSIKKIKRKIKALFFEISEIDIVMSELSAPKLQQVFVIEKGSGLVIASYSKTDPSDNEHAKQTIDQDMIAGMLTAIKSFVEDAFNAGNQSLENIEYELYTIQIQNFSS
ncbi:cell envelope biogenesis protein OmpA, partial [Flavobacterium sp.]|uniref:cell envelope biogenesis protein OmpA n=1 Tax=Flavobacterium sp. TaxID=239 RepID=UPI00286E9C25